ncbi:uncharacterized protein LOC117607126 [Osmia lignaria lignaria]|uniref:uncharacterized protein LOC117607126 n=1 Tax=Osmia lignaria lignaria TaxID=1437193 RepID=UPI00402BDBD3
MDRSILYIVLLCFVLLAVWADDRTSLTKEVERRWNTPPELIPEQLIKTSDMKNGRLLSIPIGTNINVNAGNNAHSLGFQIGPEGVSYSESNSFNRPLSELTGSVSQSQSMSLAAGLTGASGAVSQAVGQHHPIHGNQGNVNSHAFGFGNAASSSSGNVQNGHASSAAASSVGSTNSFASSNAGSSQFPEETSIRFPGQNQRPPVWTNIHPNDNNNGHQPSRTPKLDINIKPNREQNRGPVMLHVSTQQPRWDNKQPRIHIHKWHPSYRWYYNDDIQR